MLWSGGTGRTGAWQPPHRQDEDLVPLTAGACSPCRMSSRRIPRQTSRPDPSPHDGSGAASQRRGDPVRRPNLAQTPLPGGRLARWVKQRSAAYASVPRRFGPPPGHALKSRPGSRPVYRPFERLAPPPPPYRSTPNTASPVRPVGGPMSVGRASSVGGAQRLAALHEHSLAWREAPRAAVLVGLWPHELATQQRPGSRPG